MTYTQIAILAIVAVVFIDLFIIRTSLVRRRSFWTSYGIILFFQLISNWWLTSRKILTYDEGSIIGTRIAAAPVEDILFGFSMVTLTLSLWIFWGRRGIQRD